MSNLADAGLRYDPTNGFAPYEGNFDMLSTHYYASVGARVAAVAQKARARMRKYDLRGMPAVREPAASHSALSAARRAGFSGLFGVVLSVICILVPILWGLGALLRCLCACCCACAKPGARAPPPSQAVRRTAAFVALFLGAGAVAGAACVWAAGGQLRKTLSFMMVRARAAATRRPLGGLSGRPPHNHRVCLPTRAF
jgi:hypothetical protein